MKKILAIFLCGCLLMSMNACGGRQETTQAAPVQAEAAPESLLRSVMAITATEALEAGGTAVSGGSGVIIALKDGKGYLLTNYHVIFAASGDKALCESLRAAPYGQEQGEGLEATCLWYSESCDLALLEVADMLTAFPGAAAAEIKSGRLAQIGEKIFAVGNTGGHGISLHSGTVSREMDEVTLTPSYQTAPITLELIGFDAMVGTGDSGGGLFGSDGTLLGIINARRTNNGGGCAIPAELALHLAKQVLAGEKSPKLFSFGAALENRQAVTEFREETGALITTAQPTVVSLTTGSAAAAFLQQGDILLGLRLGNEAECLLTSAAQAESILALLTPGTNITLRYLREGEEHSFSFTVSDHHMKVVE